VIPGPRDDDVAGSEDARLGSDVRVGRGEERVCNEGRRSDRRDFMAGSWLRAKAVVVLRGVTAEADARSPFWERNAKAGYAFCSSSCCSLLPSFMSSSCVGAGFGFLEDGYCCDEGFTGGTERRDFNFAMRAALRAVSACRRRCRRRVS